MTEEQDLMPLLRAAVGWENLTDEVWADEGLTSASADYVGSLRDACMTRLAALDQGAKIFRARIMPVDKALSSEPLPLDEMGPPPPSAVRPGRFNTRGTSYFYAAYDPETAVAEVRPWVQARISIALFEVRSEMEIADLTSRPGVEPDQLVDWCCFILSRPVHREDKRGYAASQHLAEVLRSERVDGVCYDSRLRPGGKNILLFDAQRVQVRSVELREVVGVEYVSQTLAPSKRRSLSGIGSVIRGRTRG